MLFLYFTQSKIIEFYDDNKLLPPLLTEQSWATYTFTTQVT